MVKRQEYEEQRGRLEAMDRQLGEFKVGMRDKIDKMTHEVKEAVCDVISSIKSFFLIIFQQLIQ